MKRLLISAIVLLTVGCFALGRSMSQRSLPDALVVDTTVVILRVFNYQPAAVTVYLDTQQGGRNLVGTVTPMHEAFFVLPSVGLVAIDAFTVFVVSEADGVKPYQTGLINRNRRKITLVYVAVGDTVGARGPNQWRQS